MDKTNNWPAGSVVAAVAFPGGYEVIVGFQAQVARAAGADNSAVIKISRDPGCCHVAGTAIVGCHNMLRVFSGSTLPIVTTVAPAAANVVMVKTSCCPVVRVVAITTVLRS